MTGLIERRLSDQIAPAASSINHVKVPTVVDDIPPLTKVSDGQIFIIRNTESRYLTHHFHKYAGKFIPHVPRWALHAHLGRRKGGIVLDPFVGSGTTLVECLLDGQHGYGLDVDPLARLITKVKTTVIPQKKLRNLHTEVTDRLANTTSGVYIPSIPTLGHWFTASAIDDLSIIHRVVNDYKADSDIYDFLTICFSSIIRRSSNADNQTMKTYVSHTHAKTPERAKEIFLNQVRIYVDRLAKLQELVSGTGSATVLSYVNALTIDPDEWNGSIPPTDLVVTSPPYIKSVDYIYNQMAELFWIGDRWGLETQKQQNDFKRQYVGSDRVAKRDIHRISATGLESVDMTVQSIYMRDQKLALVAYNYFSAMHDHLATIRYRMKPGSHYVMVVGDSILAGIPIATHSLLIDVAVRLGFRVSRLFAYEVRNKHMRFPRGGRGGIVVHDWIMDLIFD